jgi:hypothetical protein
MNPLALRSEHELVLDLLLSMEPGVHVLDAVAFGTESSPLLLLAGGIMLDLAYLRSVQVMNVKVLNSVAFIHLRLLGELPSPQ